MIDMIDQLRADRATLFPITQSRVFLAHAAFSPLPARVVEAVHSAMQRLSYEGQGGHVEAPLEADARRTVGRFLGAPESDIAFVANTSTGMSLLAASTRWTTGDNVVLTRGDFPAATNAWVKAATQHGAEVRMVDAWQDDLLDHVDGRTRAVVVSTVHFATGAALPRLHSMARELRRGHVMVVLDAIQTLGTGPFTVDDFDAVVADGHKWLLGPKGAAVLYVTPETAELLDPPIVGWRNMTSDKPYGPGIALLPGAARFEAGSPNILGIVGLQAAMELLMEADLEAIERSLDLLRASVTEIVRGHQFVRSDWHPATPLISFPMERDKAQDLYAHLNSKNISVSLREDQERGMHVRISPHFYNDISDLNQLDKAIGDWNA